MTEVPHEPPQVDPSSTPPKKKTSTGKVIGIGCGGLLALVIVITAIRAIVDPEGFKKSMDEAQKGGTEQASGTTSAGEKNKSEKTVDEVLSETKWPEKGIGLSRDRIEKEWGSMLPGFSFTRTGFVDDQPRYRGTFSSLSGPTGVDMVGPPDDPYIITFTVEQQFEYDKQGLNKTTLPALRRKFAKLLGPKCEKWVSDNIGGDWPTKEGRGMEFAELTDGNRSYELRWSAISVDLRVEAE